MHNEENHGLFESNDPLVRHRQKARFSLFEFYIEELGRIRVQDFIIYEDECYEIKTQLVGLKQIILSNSIIKDPKISFNAMVEDSKTSSHLVNGEFRGCNIHL